MTRFSSSDPNAFGLEEYLVEPSLNRITGPEGAAQVEPRIMGVLVALASRPGKVWSRNDLLDEVWHDTIVNEETLTRAIFHLRKHLGDESGDPRFIETIRKGGYRLVCGVGEVGSGEGADAAPNPEAGLPTEPEGLELADPRPMGPTYLKAAVIVVALLLVGYYQLSRSRGADVTPTASAPPAVITFTSFQGAEINPSISPDGSLVAYGWRPNTEESFDLYVKHKDAETPLRLTESPEYEGYSTWSPSGSEVAFGRSGPDGHGIYVIPSIGGSPRLVLTTRSEVEGLSWSPDGETMVFSDRAEDGDPFVIRELVLATGAVRDLSSPPAFSEGDVRPAYSPDGAWVAFIRGDPAGNEDVFLMPAGGGVADRLTEDQLRVRGLTWDADAEHVVYSGYANGTYSIWRVNLRSGARSWLPLPGEWAFDPSIASETGALVYVDNWFEKNIWRVLLEETDAVSQSSEAFITSTRWDSEPQYSPSGDRVAFTSSRSGTLEIWMVDADGNNPLRVTQFEGPFVGNPRWSPDGRILAFFVTSEGFASVHTMDVAGGQPRRLTQPTANALPAAWSHDGSWLYYASDVEEGWQIWKMRPDGTEAMRVTQSGGRSAREDGDGEFLYIVRPDRPGLWRLQAGEPEGADGLEVVMDDFPIGPGYENWFFQGHTLYSLVPREGAPMAFSVNVRTFEVDSLAALPGIASPSLTVSPDEAYLLYSRVDRGESDLKLLAHPVWQGGEG